MNWLQTEVQQNPQKLFIQEGGHAYSYMDVEGMVKAYSQSLLREGIQPQDRILIYLQGSIEMVEIILACFEIGAVTSPISWKLTNKELKAVIETIQPQLIITNWNGRETFSSVSFPHICIEELLGSSRGCSVQKNDYENCIQ